MNRKTAYFELGRLYAHLRNTKTGTDAYNAEYLTALKEALNDFICFTIEEKHFSKWDARFITDLAIIVRQVWNIINYKNVGEAVYHLVERADLYIDGFMNTEEF